MKFTAILALATAALPTALAFCCGSTVGKCADGTNGTPCCATQSCNIFCCACGGHCRGSSKRSLLANADVEANSAEAAFAAADTSGNNALSLQDYLKYMKVDGTPDLWVNWFNKHDTDGDGFISLSEVNAA